VTEPTRRRLWWLLPAVLAVVWLVGAGPLGSYVGKLAEVQKNDNAAFLPTKSESTEVQRLAARFGGAGTVPAIVVYESDRALTADQLHAIGADATAVGRLPHVHGPVIGPKQSHDKRAAELIVRLDSGAGLDIGDTVAGIRDRVGGHDGLTAHVAGPGGLVADLGTAFAGIDGKLLGVTVAAVFVILIVVYRSPLLPVLVLAAASLALAVAGTVIYQLAAHGVLDLNGQSQGILFILVIGACTDYSLLLVARYREELRRHQHRLDAMRAAYRAAVEPIVASGGTVILAVLCLLLTNLKSTRGLGPVAALGIGASLLAALTFLPAVLVLLGRAAFWPVRPRYGTPESRPGRRGLWERVAGLVTRRPRLTWLAVFAVLAVLAVAFLPQLKADGTRQTDVFLTHVDSVAGQQAIGRHFPAGAGNPAQVVANAGKVSQVVEAAGKVEGVDSAVPQPSQADPGKPAIVDHLVLIEVTLKAAPDSRAAMDTVARLRAVVHRIPGADAEVGGYTAIQADTKGTSERDREVTIPLVLAVILVVLIVLLRAVVAPLVLVASVVLSFAATLGVAALVFNHVFHFPGADPVVPLFAFVFLVALGIDYNIFLMTRVREEAARHGTREGAARGLRVTGGVITSAGVVLAVTFAALAVLPILFLAQIAFLVAFGVLLDTLLVRSLLVPALTVHLGRAVWWPGRLSRGKR
jgi:RND superfamily putative drug exporter